MNHNLLDVHNVTMHFGGNSRNRGGVVALENFTLSIPSDEAKIITIAGESGSGKTTLARLILGIIQPTGGEILYRGKILPQMSHEERQEYRREVQAIFQDPFAVYNPFYPIDRLLAVPLRSFGLAHNRAEARRLIEAALEQVGLRPNEVLGRYPHQLSGGQRQRIVVARSLLLKPRLIIADEPVSMIDASLRANILENLKQLRDKFGISLLYITHDLATAHQISDELYVLYQGRVAEHGDSTAVIKTPKHPYTQLLVSSIPRPDPDHPWVGRVEIPLNETTVIKDRTGCLFKERCAHALPACHLQPPQFVVATGQSVACHLNAESEAPTGRSKR
ncbi:MAG: ABC transporter ATP-binding protein [Chloroflexi bacterium]|nr:ABC transporter ATP-binding protein [Chloroflexota bacterium]